MPLAVHQERMKRVEKERAERASRTPGMTTPRKDKYMPHPPEIVSP